MNILREILEPFEVVADEPCCLYWREIMDAFPEARVIIFKVSYIILLDCIRHFELCKPKTICQSTFTDKNGPLVSPRFVDFYDTIIQLTAAGKKTRGLNPLRI